MQIEKRRFQDQFQHQLLGTAALRLIQWWNKFIRTGIGFPLMFQILHEVALCPRLQERDVAREKTRGPGRLLSRQTAEKPQAERQRASRESKSSERRALPLSIGPCARTGLMRLEIRLQTEQVCDRKPFGPKSRSIETWFVDSEWGIQFNLRFFVYSLFSSRHGGSLFNSLSLWGGRAGGTVTRSGGTFIRLSNPALSNQIQRHVCQPRRGVSLFQSQRINCHQFSL